MFHSSIEGIQLSNMLHSFVHRRRYALCVLCVLCVGIIHETFPFARCLIEALRDIILYTFDLHVCFDLIIVNFFTSQSAEFFSVCTVRVANVLGDFLGSLSMHLNLNFSSNQPLEPAGGKGSMGTPLRRVLSSFHLSCKAGSFVLP